MGLQETTNVLVWIFTAASIIVVALRLVARLHLTKAAGWDDSVIVVALFINILSAGFASYAISRGVGRPTWSIPDDQTINAAKWAAIADAFALMSFTVPKLSVAILLSRILSVVINTKTKLILLLLPAILSIAWAAGNEGFWFGQCRPVQALWDRHLPGGRCLDPSYFMAQGVALCAFSAAVDIFYALFPIIFVRKLNMSRIKKVHLSLMLGLGVVCGAVATWKTTQFVGISVPDADVTEASAHLIYATLIEANLLIVSACVPTVLPVVRHARGHVRRGAPAPAAGNPGPGPMMDLLRTRHPRSAKVSGPRFVYELEDDSTRVLAGMWGQCEAEGGPGSPASPAVDERRGRRGFPAWRRAEAAGPGAVVALREEDEEMAIQRAVEVSVTLERIETPAPAVLRSGRGAGGAPCAEDEEVEGSESNVMVEVASSISLREEKEAVVRLDGDDDDEKHGR